MSHSVHVLDRRREVLQQAPSFVAIGNEILAGLRSSEERISSATVLNRLTDLNADVWMLFREIRTCSDRDACRFTPALLETFELSSILDAEWGVSSVSALHHLYQSDQSVVAVNALVANCLARALEAAEQDGDAARVELLSGAGYGARLERVSSIADVLVVLVEHCIVLADSVSCTPEQLQILLALRHPEVFEEAQSTWNVSDWVRYAHRHFGTDVAQRGPMSCLLSLRSAIDDVLVECRKPVVTLSELSALPADATFNFPKSLPVLGPLLAQVLLEICTVASVYAVDLEQALVAKRLRASIQIRENPYAVS
ncbi:MAG: hypothetical protein KC925_00405 [Candidatus Doudnabacteria bacterium]|nr:hypothetical protein [Candidatus Doudnabacteria bacterium]